MYKYSKGKVMLGEQIVKDYGQDTSDVKLVGEAYAKFLNVKEGRAEEKEVLPESSEEVSKTQAMSKRAY